ncbi:MAG TPA: 1-deoxy-D-xylulose-5-phosphate reductoisomerase [Verrucomicrobiae bacterium]|nr:1-deoxy-D-xylulose-5-phosphate reductoisomerase [Verrucomicrobiae bacterium]
MPDERQPKRVAILGSTGSIGTSALKVARDIPDRMRVVALAAGRNRDLLARQAAEFRPQLVCIASEADAGWLRTEVPSGTRVVSGPEGLIEMASMGGVDLVLVSIVGTGGLQPALAAIGSGKDIAVASKEILVMAGEIVMREAVRKGVRVLPVDSEHNAIFQCLEGHPHGAVKRLILTASGGPFRCAAKGDLRNVTPAQALKHPTWDMGRKITIDSATLFNKGLEMIEAKWLFGMPIDRVNVVVHPQSIIHSMVEFVDGSVLAQLSHSDMCFPIQYAVTYPDRLANTLEPLDFAKVGSLSFEAPDEDKFPALRLAREAGSRCGTLPAVLNAANEVGVERFLAGAATFPAIWETVEAVMRDHRVVEGPDLAAILEADREARRRAAEILAAGA